MTRYTAPDLRTTQVFLLGITLRPELSRTQHRRFYGQMRRAMHAFDLMLGRYGGLCVLVQIGRAPAYDFRERVVGWLIDQREFRRAVVNTLHPVDA